MKPRWILIGVILAALAGTFFIPSIPSWLPWVYLAVSLLAFIAYGWDKSRARQGGWRTQEATLQLLAAMGGWPGAFLGQVVYRHKTKKISFQIVFWLIVAVHAFVWWYLLVRP